jgi:hypothetical protein
MRRRRKGQAALEYLVTYGWGFLVIIVVIGAMAYFGLFNPTRYIPARCEFGSQMECADYRLWLDTAPNPDVGHVTLQFRNSFGDDIKITKVQIGTITPATTVNKVVKRGELSEIIDATFTNGAGNLFFVKNERGSVPVIVTFERNRVDAPSHNITGDVFATVQ